MSDQIVLWIVAFVLAAVYLTAVGVLTANVVRWVYLSVKWAYRQMN